MNQADYPGNSPDVDTLKMELALVKERTRALEADLARSRKTIDLLLADDLLSSEENASLRQRVWEAHQFVHASCACSVCHEVEQSWKELDELSFNE
jgi:hypothetical protein